MFSKYPQRVRGRLTYANVTATLALVLALGGGAAYAAGHYLITSTKQIKPSVLAQLKGKAGPAGAAGPQGPQGSQGPQGLPGTPGTTGTNGKDGTNGKSVVVADTAAHCPAGGITIEVEGSGQKHEVCNGNPAEYPKTLPAGRTETGTWSAGPGASVLSGLGLNVIKGGEVEAEYQPGKFRKERIVTEVIGTPEGASWYEHTSISFPIEVDSPLVTLIPYGAELGLAKPVGVKAESGKYSFYELTGTGAKEAEEAEAAYAKACPGSFGEPKAAPGFLCIYFGEGKTITIIGASGHFEEAHPFGINLPFSFGEDNGFRASGSWAVTAK